MPEKPFVFLALSGRDASPETLAELSGGGRRLETNLPYTPPYENFKGIRELQLAGKNPVPAAAFRNGQKAEGTFFS